MDWGLYLTIVLQLLGGVVALGLVVFVGCAVIVGIRGMWKDDK